jgi:hypothetical protein
MKDTSGEAILLAAKFKNQYEINRFLVSVLTEFSMRLLQMSEETATSLKNKTVIKSERIVLSKEVKKAIAKQVKLDRNYFKTHLAELVEEYLNAVPHLTISYEEREKALNKKLGIENKELYQKNIEIAELKKS